jgi:hypothetical protein
MTLVDGDFFNLFYMPCTLPYNTNKIVGEGVYILVQHHFGTWTYIYLMLNYIVFILIHKLTIQDIWHQMSISNGNNRKVMFLAQL